MCPGVGLKGGSGSLPIPLWCLCRGHAQYPAFVPNTLFFALGSSEMAVGFFCLFVFVSFGPEFAPTRHAHSYL